MRGLVSASPFATYIKSVSLSERSCADAPTLECGCGSVALVVRAKPSAVFGYVLRLALVVPSFSRRPAAADFVWFVYGSSLDRAAFAEWASSHGYQLPELSRARPARLPGFRLSFDVVSRHWGGAVASLHLNARKDGLEVPCSFWVPNGIHRATVPSAAWRARERDRRASQCI